MKVSYTVMIMVDGIMFDEASKPYNTLEQARKSLAELTHGLPPGPNEKYVIEKVTTEIVE